MTSPVLGDVVIVGGGCYGTFYARQLIAARNKAKASFGQLLIVDRDPSCQFSRELGEAPDRRLVVEDWDHFFDHYFAEKSAEAGSSARLAPTERPRERNARPGARESFRARPPGRDVIVPSPLMPHLMYHWVLRQARRRWPGREVETVPLPEGPATPYDRSAPDGTRYVSFADWICPTHCVEPAICPITCAPRTWEMSDAVVELTGRLAAAGHVAGPVLFRCEHLVHGVGTFSVADVLAGDRLVQEAGAPGRSVDLPVGTLSSCHGAVNLLHLGPI